jgi:CheY-like chemotaxis protein
MQDYALIAGSDADIVELYADLVREGGIEALVAAGPDQAIRILAEHGQPRLVVVDLGVARDGGFVVLRHLRQALSPGDRPFVLALVAPELGTTAGDLTDALGIDEALPSSAGELAVRAAIRRALTIDASGRYPVLPEFEPLPGPGAPGRTQRA